MVPWLRLHAPNAGSPGSIPGWGIKIPQAVEKKKKYKCYIKLPQSCLTLCDAMDCSPPGPSVHGFPRKEYWSGLPFPSPGDLLNPGIKPTSLMSPALAGGFFTTSAVWEELPCASVVPLLVTRPEKTIIQNELGQQLNQHHHYPGVLCCSIHDSHDMESTQMQNNR